eukprot:CAMPEP_0206212066 /NCGR_PEP_ID=MMETSP0047_2-20121206/348_1 /ASSEMBLY_ACC=CAM_ASM_000192 /TAXON_ID=195065 /ORGANISM="Chroomonas mesostigmatica_cf, Strain CCMP1168" /LENGTH=264 /DNA_ID=CAMNT_0053634039 /DNA_START=415 /DNA_END=1209 /DNA_ORIENTATION=+
MVHKCTRISMEMCESDAKCARELGAVLLHQHGMQANSPSVCLERAQAMAKAAADTMWGQSESPASTQQQHMLAVALNTSGKGSLAVQEKAFKRRKATPGAFAPAFGDHPRVPWGTLQGYEAGARAHIEEARTAKDTAVVEICRQALLVDIGPSADIHDWRPKVKGADRFDSLISGMSKSHVALKIYTRYGKKWRRYLSLLPGVRKQRKATIRGLELRARTRDRPLPATHAQYRPFILMHSFKKSGDHAMPSSSAAWKRTCGNAL